MNRAGAGEVVWIVRVCGFLMMWVVGLVGGCDRSASDELVLDRRVVTLAPAISQMMVDLGVDDQLVGVSEYDVSAPVNLPMVGNFLDVNHEALLSADPSLVMLMATVRQGVPPMLLQLGESGRFDVVAFDYPKTIADVMATLWCDSDDPQASVGSVLGLGRESAELRARLEWQMGRLRECVASSLGVRVLLVIGLNPVMAVGPGQVLDEMLSIAGGENAAGDATVGAPTFDREHLIATQAEVVLLLMPGAMGLADHWAEDPRLVEFDRLPIPAVENSRFVMLNDPLVVLPSTSLVGVTMDMARAIHPDRVDAIDVIERSDLVGQGDVGQMRELLERDGPAVQGPDIATR